MPIKIFFSYAHEDEALLSHLQRHLRLLQRQGLIDVWHDRDISAGTEWEGKISEQLNAAQIILLLVSPNFMDSDYCYSVEMRRALERHITGEAQVIPIILRPVDWHNAPFSRLQVLPRDAQPVTSWANPDEALLQITHGIRQIIHESLAISQNRPQQEVEVGQAIKSYPLAKTRLETDVLNPIIAVLIKAQQWEQAEAEIYSIKNLHDKTRALGSLTNALIKAQQWGRSEAVARSIENRQYRSLILKELAIELAKAQQWGRSEAVARSIENRQLRAQALDELSSRLLEAGELWRAKDLTHGVSDYTSTTDEASIIISDEYFVRTKRTRLFRPLGTLLNILSALVILISGPFPSSVFAAIIGGVISIAMLWRCTISVKKPIAIAFGVGVAFWWGYVAASVAEHSDDIVIVFLSFFIAFIIILGIHIRYVNNRLKN